MGCVMSAHLPAVLGLKRWEEYPMCFVGSLLEMVRPNSSCLGPDLLVLTPFLVMSQSFPWWSVAHNEDSRGF